jgi:Zn ribbon nucleic-acid-binding protein
MPVADESPGPIDPREFDRRMNAKVLEYGSREDARCPACGTQGFRRVADSEMVALFACRNCGHQEEVLHETKPEVAPPFREYREGRGFRAAVEDQASDPEDKGEP